MVTAFCIVVDIPVGKFLGKKGMVVDSVLMVIDKLLLERPVVALDEGVNLGTPRVNEEVGNPVSFKLFVKHSKVLRPVV